MTKRQKKSRCLQDSKIISVFIRTFYRNLPCTSIWFCTKKLYISSKTYQAKDKAVITSGGYERYFEKNGKKYHHIIDPATGYPAENGLTSVTIVSDDGTLADGLSTSLFIMGKEKAEKFWKKYSDKFDVILLTDDDQLYVSEGIADDFQSDYKVNIMKK